MKPETPQSWSDTLFALAGVMSDGAELERRAEERRVDHAA